VSERERSRRRVASSGGASGITPELSFSYDEIGRRFDRDHPTTVISGVRARERAHGAVKRSLSIREARTEPAPEREPEPAA